MAHNFAATILDSTSPVLYDILHSATVPNCDCTESIAHNLDILYQCYTMIHATQLKRDITAPNGTTPNATELIQYLTKPTQNSTIRHGTIQKRHHTLRHQTKRCKTITILVFIVLYIYNTFILDRILHDRNIRNTHRIFLYRYSSTIYVERFFVGCFLIGTGITRILF